MRSTPLVLFFILLFCFLTTVQAQGTACKVLLKALTGKYAGDCKQGRADGMGKAEGTDQYTGQFKAGLPEGRGTYLWSNGDAFEGIWKKGKREGMGVMLKNDGSKISGLWRNDIYLGNFEKPFIITQQSSFITSSDLKNDYNSKEKFIQFNISNTGGATSLLGGILPKPELSDITVLNGSYSEIIDGLENQRSIIKKLLNVTFPLRARIIVDRQNFDFEIFEPGAWIVTLELQAHTINGGR